VNSEKRFELQRRALMEPTQATSLAETNKFERLCGILDHFGRHPARLVPILQALQEEYRYLPEEVLSYVATSLHIPEANVFGVATFYAHFALEPKGKYIVRLCDGTACHVKQSIPILEALRQRLGLSEKKITTRTCCSPWRPWPVSAPAAWPRFWSSTRTSTAR
jgi:NADH-quinone oxidoreductase subunit E